MPIDLSITALAFIMNRIDLTWVSLHLPSGAPSSVLAVPVVVQTEADPPHVDQGDLCWQGMAAEMVLPLLPPTPKGPWTPLKGPTRLE